MRRSNSIMKYSLSIAAAIILVPYAVAAPSEQTQNQSQQGNAGGTAIPGSNTQNQSQQGSQAGAANQNGILAPTLPRPENPVQEVSHTTGTAVDKGGIAWQNFLLYPELSATMMYDDNIYASRKNERSDTIVTITPEIRAKSNFNRHALEFGSGIDMNRYYNHTAEDTNDPWAYAKGRIDISDKTNVYGGVNVARSHEDRSSPNALEIEKTTALANPILYTNVGGNVGMYHAFNDKLALRLGASASKLNFKDTTLVGGGTYSNDYRDRTESLAGGRLIYSASDSLDLFVQGASDLRRYDNVGIYDRNSHGFNAAVGATFKPSDALSGEAYVGRIRQYYSDSRFDAVSAADYGFNVKYYTTPWTALSMNLDRSLEETTVSGASGYINTALTGRLEHSLSRDVSLNASLTRHWSDYNDISRTDVYTGAGVGAKVYLSNLFYAAADYKYRKRSSTATTLDPNSVAVVNYAEYDNNLFYVTLGTDFGTRAKPSVPSFTYPNWSLFASPFSNTLTGFYAGAALGVNSLNASTFGYRDPWTGNPNNYDQGQFGEIGIISGLFGGYGQMLSRHIYLGVEAEADRSNARLSHDHVGDTHFTIGQNNGYALSLRPGYMLDNGSLLYGRVGWARTKFNNYIHALDEAPGSTTLGQYYTVDQDKTMDGFRLGVGTDIPMGNNLFVRMDYAYTDYKSYSIPVINADGTLLRDDRADISGGTFKLGLGWNFGAPASEAKTLSIDPNYLDGMYVGAMVGHGPINTNVHALHSDGTTLNADFGADGMTGGAFLGYGHTFGSWYIGAELEAEASTFGWHHDRQTGGAGGRDYYVHKKGSFGESVRLGYVLKNGSLLYGRIGRVDTKFNTEYNKGAAGGNNWVDQDDTAVGTRVGLGTEVPFNKALFMRMDYSYTKYSAYTFTDGSGTPDTATYKNDESLFRFGLGYHF